MSEEIINEQQGKADGDKPPSPRHLGGGRDPSPFGSRDDDPLRAFPIVKLDFKEKDRLTSGSNYDVWALSMRGFFRKAKLWLWVDDTFARPSLTELEKHLLLDGKNSEAQNAWNTLAERAQGIIRIGLHEAMVMSTSSAIIAREM